MRSTTRWNRVWQSAGEGTAAAAAAAAGSAVPGGIPRSIRWVTSTWKLGGMISTGTRLPCTDWWMASQITNRVVVGQALPSEPVRVRKPRDWPALPGANKGGSC